MKSRLTFILLIFINIWAVSCGVLIPAHGPEVISIQVLNEQKEPIKNIIVKQLCTFPENTVEITNALNGTVILPIDWWDAQIYIGSPGYAGKIVYAKDAVIILTQTNN